MKRLTGLLAIVAVLFAVLSANFASATERYVYFDVEQTSPATNSSNVSIDTKEIVLTFTRSIERGNGEIILWGNGVQLPFTEKVVGNQLVITPLNPLEYRKTYSVTLRQNAIVNAEIGDNSLSTLRDNYTMSFSTPFLSDMEIAKINASQSLTNVTTLQLLPETNIQSAFQVFTLKINSSNTFKLNKTNGNYKLWTSNPQLVSVQAQGDSLIIKGLATGTAQVAVRNLVDNTKVVLNVVVQ